MTVFFCQLLAENIQSGLCGISDVELNPGGDLPVPVSKRIVGTFPGNVEHLRKYV